MLHVYCSYGLLGPNLPVSHRSPHFTSHLAELCHRAGVPGAALALYRRAIDFRCRLYGDSHALIAEYLTGLAELHSRMGNDAKAGAVRNRIARLAQVAGKCGNAGRRDSPRTAG